jgi:glycosyltransferase involved in cell wall biosynthesis
VDVVQKTDIWHRATCLANKDKMTNFPLVSCIIVFFNGDRFIEEAIASVFSQTYNCWELLLVDDGSTDNSSAIALNYAQLYPEKVLYLEQESHQNCGVSAARNLGIRYAKGEYIAFLDADDIWLPQKLERQIKILESQPEAVMVFGPTQYWYSWTGNPQDQQLDWLREIGIEPNTLLKPPILVKLLLGNQVNSPNPSGVLIQRQVCEEIDGFPEELVLYEDQAFFAKVCLHHPVFLMNEYFDLYRQHPDSCCAIAEKMGRCYPGHLNPAHLTFLNWVADYLEQQGVKNPEICHVLQKALRSYERPFLYYLLRPTHFLRLIGRKLLPARIREGLWVQYQAIARSLSQPSRQK